MQNFVACQDFVERGNIGRFEEQLKFEIDPIKRAMLKTLLSDEEIKHALSAVWTA